jgi:hypothetical protein
MAEAVGIGVGVASFAIQIADGLIKLKDFIELMTDAPGELRAIIRRVEEVEVILKNIEARDRELDGNVRNLVNSDANVKGCREAANRLAIIAKEIITTTLGSNFKGR